MVYSMTESAALACALKLGVGKQATLAKLLNHSDYMLLILWASYFWEAGKVIVKPCLPAGLSLP